MLTTADCDLHLGKNIPLGPYYLIWDNRNDPALIAAGARDWPYQTADVSLARDPDAALRPPGSAMRSCST